MAGLEKLLERLIGDAFDASCRETWADFEADLRKKGIVMSERERAKTRAAVDFGFACGYSAGFRALSDTKEA